MRSGPQHTQNQQYSIRVLLISNDVDLAAVLEEIVKKFRSDLLIYELDSLEELQGEQLRPSDILVMDTPDREDINAFLEAERQGMLRYAQKLILCSAALASACQDMILKELIQDYLIVRPSLNPAYLEVQIWRMLRTASGQRTCSSLSSTPPPVEKQIAEPAAGSSLSGRKALVVDNHPPSIRLLSDILRHIGFSVLTASSLANAATVHRDRQLDIVFLDIAAPGLSGSQAIRSLRQSLRCPAPILVVSAYAERKIVEDCARAGAVDFVVKPVRPGILRERVLRLLNI